MSSKSLVTSTALCLALAVALSAPASAGYKQPVATIGNVYVSPSSRYASGWLSHARNSPSTVERIECGLAGYANQFMASCAFVDGNGVQGACTTSNPNIVQTIAALQGDGLVVASWDASGVCSSVSTYVDSALAPKAP